MPKSINQNIQAGGSVYHVQTEYYKSSGKVVTNIFKDGRSVKRLEKELSAKEEEEINREVEEFHSFVVSKLTGKLKAKRSGEKKGLTLPLELYDKLLVLVSPYFGIASSLILDEGLKSSRSVEELVSFLTAELEGEQKESLSRELYNLLNSLKEEERGESKEEKKAPFSVTPDLEKRVLELLSEYFGIMASAIWEESLEEWRMSGGTTYEELVDVIVSHGELPEEKEELRTRLSFLQTGG
jgi:hypothetical protein